MNYLTFEKVSKSYGDRVLFEDITFYLDKGEKLALIAQNGKGKSTILKIIAGLESADGLSNVHTNPNIRVGYLPQMPVLDLSQTVLEAVFDADTPSLKAIKKYEVAMQNPEDTEAMQKAITQMDDLKAWDYDVSIRQMLAELKITQLDQHVSTLSGGQMKRVALAKILIEEPELLILDEPTNHLDMDMIEWLENYFISTNISLLMVTHDRYFLERVCNKIIELEDSKIYSYKGNYSYFLEKKAAREENTLRTVGRAKKLMKKELGWIRRQPKARGTKAKSRVSAFDGIKEKATQKINDEAIELEIQYRRLGSKILEFHNVHKSFDDFKILEKFDYKFKKNERVGIVGPNGVGKSTFLELVNGNLGPDAGKIVIGDTVVFGYYTQDGMNLRADKRVIDVIKDIAEFIPMNKGRKLSASQMLERFLFDPKQQLQYVSTLSGGEKRRLYLLTVLMDNPNFLILDEPTNDLDILTLNLLEDFLETYQGCLMIVTHDRYFMDKLVEHIFVFKGEGLVKDFNGNYSAYREVKILEDQQIRSEARKQKEAAKTKRLEKKEEAQTMSREDRKEFRRLGKDIEKLEEKITAINARFDNPNLSVEEITDLSKELSSFKKDLSEKEDRWLELSEFA